MTIPKSQADLSPKNRPTATLHPRTDDSLRPNRPSISGTLLIGYFLLKPFYIWDSGLPQPADALLVLFIAHVVIIAATHRGRSKAGRFPQLLTLFIGWSVLVNIAAALAVDELSHFATAALMNVFNLGAALAVTYLGGHQRTQLMTAAYYGSAASLALQVVLYLTSGGSGLRATGSFNNPNQLAFFGLLCIGVLLLGHHAIAPSRVVTILGIVAGLICISVSLSRAGLLAAILMLLGSLIWPPEPPARRRRFRLGIIATLVGASLLLAQSTRQGQATWVSTFGIRAGQEDAGGFQSARGYDRILEFPQYWIQGAGEGAFWRFDAASELHSTLGTIQVSYGVIGTLLFTGVLLSALRPSKFTFAYIIIGALVYGTAHNGIRNTIFWMILAILATMPLRTQSSASETRKDDVT